MKKLVRFAVGALAIGAMTVGVLALTPQAAAVSGGCICPMIYAPVKCDNGRTYSNGCVASCAHATGCVPVFILPPPIQ